MAAEEKKTDTPVDAPASGKKNSNKIAFIGILTGVVILNTVIAFLLIQMTKPKAAPNPLQSMAVDTTRQKKNDRTTLGAISDPPVEAIVNIAGTDGMRFLKVVVRFEYDDKKYKSLGEELVRRSPKLKDLLLDLLSDITLEELRKSDAKDEIRRDLKRIVNNTLPTEVGKIRDVYLNDFIIQ
ncbi:MAG: flagellar basal body-associated FliL family protein [Fibrobacterota bacterium]